MKIVQTAKTIHFSWPMWVVSVDSTGTSCRAMFKEYSEAFDYATRLKERFTNVLIHEVTDVEQ